MPLETLSRTETRAGWMVSNKWSYLTFSPIGRLEAVFDTGGSIAHIILNCTKNYSPLVYLVSGTLITIPQR